MGEDCINLIYPGKWITGTSIYSFYFSNGKGIFRIVEPHYRPIQKAVAGDDGTVIRNQNIGGNQQILRLDKRAKEGVVSAGSDLGQAIEDLFVCILSIPEPGVARLNNIAVRKNAGEDVEGFMAQ